MIYQCQKKVVVLFGYLILLLYLCGQERTRNTPNHKKGAKSYRETS